MEALANSSAELSRGQALDRYELVYPVARGGMARVWVAKLRGKHGFEKMVALKTILPTFAEQARFRRMFLDEAKIASGIEHVNVAQILDLGEHQGQLYLVMEWVDGDSLQELDRAAEKAGEMLPIPVIVRMIADACAGLHAAHELTDAQGKLLNVVHRDVSPQNILISAKGVVKIIDFGVVKARSRTTEETNTGTIKGKLQYMAPEQALGHAVDRRADVWSVGATLYRMLARRPVYSGSSPLSTYKRLTETANPEPLPAHVPRGLAAIVLKALSFDASRRFSTAAELGAALEGLLRGQYQTTTRDVAACVEQYLGAGLAARRAAIAEALEYGDDERTEKIKSEPEWESGVSQAGTLPRIPSSAPPSGTPTGVTRSLKPPADEPTRSLRPGPLPPLSAPPMAPATLSTPPTMPSMSAPPSRRSRLVAAGGAVALGGALAWTVWGSGSTPPPSALASQRSTSSIPAPAANLPPASPLPPVEAAPVDALPPVEAAPPAETAEPAPATNDAPLSVQSLPMLKDKKGAKRVAAPKAAAPRVAPKRAPAPVARPAAPVARPAAPAPAPAPAAPRKVVDDGF